MTEKEFSDKLLAFMSRMVQQMMNIAPAVLPFLTPRNALAGAQPIILPAPAKGYPL
jgi:hypothetical protein